MNNNISNYALFLILITQLSVFSVALKAEEVNTYPNINASPISENLFPTKVIENGVTIYQFHTVSITRRIGISLHSFEKTKVKAGFTWIPDDISWGNQSGYFTVNTNEGTNCFFLGAYAGIPENVSAKEFQLHISTDIQIENVVFSSLPSERAIQQCPMPKLENEIQIAYEKCKLTHNAAKDAKVFVSLLKKAMYKYDCRRDFDYEPVPAWYLTKGEKVDEWFDLLSKLEIIEAKELFESKLFTDTLDGCFAEWYYDIQDSKKKQ